MGLETGKEIALFKYGIIAPVCGGFLSQCSKAEFYRSAAEKEYTLPDGKKRKYEASTIKKWTMLYAKGGIEALMPKKRADKGKSRTISEETGNQIRTYKEQFPKITGQMLFEKLLEDGTLRHGESSVDSIYRYLKSANLVTGGIPPEECLAFEFDHANDCWQADTVDGPYIKADGLPPRKTFLISFIDDASRLHPHGEFFFEDNGVNVQKVLKKAILKAGCPRMIFDDNGGPYRNHQLDWICAQLGIVLVHSRAYHPKGKGKEERSHKTAQMRFLDCTDFSSCHSLEELNQKYWGYLEKDYHNKKHSGIGTTPRERYMQDYRILKFPDPEKLEEAFLHSVTRRVNNAACITIEKRIYEVPQEYIGQKIHLRYHPENREEIYIYDEDSGKRICSVKFLNKSENCRRKRRMNISYAGGEEDV